MSCRAEITLVTDAGEEVLRAGECAGFKANDKNGHCLQNRSRSDAVALEIGSRITGERAHYSDIDMLAHAGSYTHRDGTPYPKAARRGA